MSPSESCSLILAQEAGFVEISARRNVKAAAGWLRVLRLCYYIQVKITTWCTERLSHTHTHTWELSVSQWVSQRNVESSRSVILRHSATREQPCVFITLINIISVTRCFHCMREIFFIPHVGLLSVLKYFTRFYTQLNSSRYKMSGSLIISYFY